MAMMMGKLYTALLEAGANEKTAREAGEEAAEKAVELKDVQATQRLHTWILSFNTAMLVALIAHAFLGK